MSVNRLWSILLLSAYLFPVDEIVLNWSTDLWGKHWALTSSIRLEGHWMTNSNSVRMIIHFEDFLLLSRQILIRVSDRESHSSWQEDVASLIWRVDGCIGSHEVVLVRSISISGLKWLKVWSTLVAIISYVSTSLSSTFGLCSKLSSRHSFLIMTVQLLNIETTTPLIIAKSWIRTRF